MWLLICGIACPTHDLHAQSHLVAAYGLDEGGGSIAEDASGNSNNGTVLGGVWTTSGRFGNALSFDGTKKGRVDISSSASLDLQNGMTLEAWVYVTKKTGSRTVISKKKSSRIFLCTVCQWFASGNLHFPGEEKIQGERHRKTTVEYLGPSCCDIRWSHVAAVC